MRLALKFALGLLSAAIAAAQPATTTVTDTLRLANGSTFCGGQITLSWTTFTSMDGYRIQGGSFPVSVNPLTGVFSVNLVPTNTNTNPNQGFYSIRYDLRPTICAAATSTWKVPSSGPTNLAGVESVSIPPPPQIPVNSLQSPGTAGTFELCYVNGVAQWGTCGGATITQGTARQIKVVSSSGTFTLSLPPDLLLSGQSANGTDMLSGSRATDTSPTGNFENFKSAAGASLWQVDVTGTLQAGTVSFNRLSMNAANVVSLFSGCSGTLLLAANGTCSSSGSGTVTSFSAGNLSPLFTTSVATATTTPALSFTASSAAQNSVLAGPASGGAGAYSFRALVGADLPNPSASTLGGIQSYSALSHQWINAISILGVPSSSQPAFTDLSGSAACGQLPALTGDTTTSAGSCATTTGSVDGVSYPASPGTNTVPVVTAPNIVTYEKVPNAAIQNPSTTVNGQTCTLGSTCTISSSSVSFGPYSSLPATCTTGAIYLFNDNTLYTRADCTATNTWSLRHNSAPMTLPPSCGSLTWVNQNASGTCSNTQGALVMATTVTAACCSNQLLVQSTPSTPYSFTTELVYSGPNANNGSTNAGHNAGIAIRDSSGGKFSACEIYTSPLQTGLYVVRFEHWTNPTTDSATMAYNNLFTALPPRLKIRDDGTNHYCYYSLDEGLHWSELYQESRTAFVPSGGNTVGFVQLNWNMLSVDTAYVNFLDWTQGT